MIDSNLRGNHIDGLKSLQVLTRALLNRDCRSITGRQSYIPGHLSWGREWCHPQKLLPRRNHMERCVKSSLGALSPSRPSLLSAAFTNDGSRTLEKEFQPAWWLRIPKQLFVYQLLCQTHDIALDDRRWIRNWLALHQIMD